MKSKIPPYCVRISYSHSFNSINASNRFSYSSKFFFFAKIIIFQYSKCSYTKCHIFRRVHSEPEQVQMEECVLHCC